MEKYLNPSSSSSRAKWGGRAESWGPFLKTLGWYLLVHFTLFPAPSIFCLLEIAILRIADSQEV
eukprot:snap_masked-scaffold_4-processed-gene-15.15-mRNA-1 protein AED:1.00 eAED:1.00 QI:0/0/0/0/1/1/2/0/63